MSKLVCHIFHSSLGKKSTKEPVISNKKGAAVQTMQWLVRNSKHDTHRAKKKTPHPIPC